MTRRPKRNEPGKGQKRRGKEIVANARITAGETPRLGKCREWGVDAESLQKMDLLKLTGGQPKRDGSMTNLIRPTAKTRRIAAGDRGASLVDSGLYAGGDRR